MSDALDTETAIERGSLAVGMGIGGFLAAVHVHLLASPAGAYVGAVLVGAAIEVAR